MSLIDRLLGQPLASWEESENRIGVLGGVPTLGLDGLGSAAYGPEAALTVLMPLGALGLDYIGPITLVILVLLGILYFSYRQTISAYPTGGGSYTVAKKNLGIRFGLLAAAALMLDYTLNVAVGISSGIGQLVSAVPHLHQYTLTLCLAVLGLIALVNLRGAREAGALFAIPTYLFIATLVAVIGLGLLHGRHPHAVVPPHPLARSSSAVSLWLLLRAFASGCTAMTGVEAVSNGVTAFAEPKVKNAERTLTVIVGTLAFLLAGVSYLSHTYHIGAMDENRAGYQSVISQLVAAAAGRGVFYYLTLGSTFAVLMLSANTSFAGFPRLCRLVAMDDYLPHAFTIVGRRLVYTVGIVFLTGLAGLLLIVFGGITDNLIPLFAVGAFLAFTLSQAGMVVHWRRNAGKEGREKGQTGAALAINAIGAVATGVALAVILVAKFTQGAWVTVLIIPALLLLFIAIKRHYHLVARQTRCPHPLDLSDHQPLVVVVPISEWNMQTERALHFALRLSPEVFAVHMSVPEDGQAQQTKPQTSDADELAQLWAERVEAPARQADLPVPRLVILPSPYRRVIKPLLDYIKNLQKDCPGRIITVVVPELVERHWWTLFLHNHMATALRGALLLYGNQRVVVIDVPWYLQKPSVDTHPANR